MKSITSIYMIKMQNCVGNRRKSEKKKKNILNFLYTNVTMPKKGITCKSFIKIPVDWISLFVSFCCCWLFL